MDTGCSMCHVTLTCLRQATSGGYIYVNASITNCSTLRQVWYVLQDMGLNALLAAFRER